MILWNKWRNPIVVVAVAVMLAVSTYASFAVASDVNDAADGGIQLGAISKAAADVELAWTQMIGADALAATGQASAEAQASFDSATNLYNSSKAVLAAADKDPINQALAGSDQGLVLMNDAFAGTMDLAKTGEIARATANHTGGVLVLYASVEPAVKGLAQVGQAADLQLKARMDNGAADLRLLGWISAAVVALGAAFAGWSAWSIYRRDEEEDEADSMATEPSASWEEAA